MDQSIHIVGIGDDGLEGLSDAARQIVKNAKTLIGTARVLSSTESLDANRVEVSGNPADLVEAISQCGDQCIAILANGDPLFFGMTRFLCDHLGKDRFEVIPNVSSMQLAFARVKESWDEAYLADLSSVPISRVLARIRSTEKAGLFTNDAITPASIAQALLDAGVDYFSVYVCENLGSPDERVTHGQLTDVAGQQFASLNVMILVRKPNAPDHPVERFGKQLFGNPDQVFQQSRPQRELLTPLEIRAVALALMDIGPHSVIWDVGAGTGSVAIEAAQLAPAGQVFAIEMATEDHQMLCDNAALFHVDNLTPVLGQAPEIWQDLPDPDAVFVDGTGRAVGMLVAEAIKRLKTQGRLVISVKSLDNLASVRGALAEAGVEPEVRMIQVSQGTPQMDTLRLESRNPTFLISTSKSCEP